MQSVQNVPGYLKLVIDLFLNTVKCGCSMSYEILLAQEKYVLPIKFHVTLIFPYLTSL